MMHSVRILIFGWKIHRWVSQGRGETRTQDIIDGGLIESAKRIFSLDFVPRVEFFLPQSRTAQLSLLGAIRSVESNRASENVSDGKIKISRRKIVFRV